jgi:acetyltransferase-like isoleucine patch superfamily enzyme
MQETLFRLQKRGAIIGRNIKVGQRVQFDIHAGAKLIIGDDVQIQNDTILIAYPNDTLQLGAGMFIGQHCTISGNVTIGKNTLLAGFVTIIDANHRFDDVNADITTQGGVRKPIVIGDDVWIATDCIVLLGVTIGSHSVIGANSTVTEDIPSYAVAVGSPARVIKMRK